LDNPKSLSIVCVDWYDAVCSGGANWQTAEDIEEAITNGPSKVRTVGMLLKQTALFVAVCDTIILDGSAGGYVHVIPTGMIDKMRFLQ
jgi:hypothetical protein